MKFYWLGIILISISLSYFSGTVFPYFFGQNPMEPVLFFGVYLLFKKNVCFRNAFNDVLNKNIFWFLFIYATIMLLLGIINTGTILPIYADFRSNLLFFFLLFFLN